MKMKRGGTLLLAVLAGIFLMNFASAAYYANYSLSYLLNQLDASTIFLGAVFIIAFAFINFSLSKVFRGNKATSGIVAFALALLITYGINRSGFDFEGLFYNFGYAIGLSSDVIYLIVSLILIALAIYLIIKLKKDALILIGLFFGVLAYFAENGLVLLLLGILLIIIRIFIPRGTWERQSRGDRGREDWARFFTRR